MKAKNSLILKASKLLLVFCTLFSQLSFSLEVFAEEVIDVSEEVASNSLEENSTSNVDDDKNINTIDTDSDLGSNGEVTALEDTLLEEVTEEQDKEVNNKQVDDTTEISEEGDKNGNIVDDNDNSLEEQVTPSNESLSSTSTVENSNNDETNQSSTEPSNTENEITNEDSQNNLENVTLLFNENDKIITIDGLDGQELTISNLVELIKNSKEGIQNISVKYQDGSSEVVDNSIPVNDDNIGNIVVVIDGIEYTLSFIKDTEDSSDLINVSLNVLEDTKVITIDGVFDQDLTVSDLKKLIKNVKQDVLDENILVKFSSSSSAVIPDDTVINNENMKNIVVVINEAEYTLSVLYDYNSDGKVNYSDLDFLCTFGEIGQEKYNDDETYKKLSYLNRLLQNNGVVESKEAIDKLNVGYSIDDAVIVGNKVRLTVKLNGFKDNSVDVFAGRVKFDSNLLKLSNISVVDVDGNDNNILSTYNDEGYFIICLTNSYNTNSVDFLTLEFDTLSEGFSNVSFDYLSFFDSGVKLNVTYGSDLEVAISPDNGKGGEYITDEENQDEILQEESKTEKVDDVVKANEVPTLVNVSNVVDYVALSSNNYINTLEIKGYDIEFNMYTYEYTIDVLNDVDSLDITVVLDGANATYEILGNEEFKEGSNKVEIVVTAEDGSKRTYTINVNKKEAKKVSKSKPNDDDTESSKSGASKTIIVILIVLVIIGLIYVIFKDDEEDVTTTKNNNKK